MSFMPISIEQHIKMYKRANPSIDENKYIKSLNAALQDYKNGIKCRCGNDIWVIGSANAGNACFTCITGENFPTDDYEIDQAIVKKQPRPSSRHIDDMEPGEIHGIFDDDGYEVNTELVQKPSLCLTCIYNDDPREEYLCIMNRFDQRNDDEFKCGEYKSIR